MSQCIISADTLNLPVEFSDMFKGQKVELIKKEDTVLIKLTNAEDAHYPNSNDAQIKLDSNELENDHQMIRQRAWDSPDSLRKTAPLHLGKRDWTREDLYDR